MPERLHEAQWKAGRRTVATVGPLYATWMPTLLEAVAYAKYLEPENVVLCHDGTVKLIDFGSSCFVSERIDFYIQSIFYRSPEVVLGFKLGVEIDAWSLGVLAYEMFTSMPLFKTSRL